jgi:hypothetical protein
MIDAFLEEIFLSNAIAAALSRNAVYEPSCSDEKKGAVRRALADLLRHEALRYATPVSDADHYRAIRRISEILSNTQSTVLIRGRFRYGTAQKAFNLYLKFLWRFGEISEPPHCPIDSIVLGKARINGSWTKCDCEGEYMKWVDALKIKAKPLSLSEWEYKVWLKKRG